MVVSTFEGSIVLWCVFRLCMEGIYARTVRDDFLREPASVFNHEAQAVLPSISTRAPSCKLVPLHPGDCMHRLR